MHFWTEVSVLHHLLIWSSLQGLSFAPQTLFHSSDPSPPGSHSRIVEQRRRANSMHSEWSRKKQEAVPCPTDVSTVVKNLISCAEPSTSLQGIALHATGSQAAHQKGQHHLSSCGIVFALGQLGTGSKGDTGTAAPLMQANRNIEDDWKPAATSAAHNVLPKISISPWSKLGGRKTELGRNLYSAQNCLWPTLTGTAPGALGARHNT